ncbi:hypothetical protein Ocin01_17217 [Orchesella cincta]|uniref:Uncharacterized protein n=1 Tax=Orchesella cincta TaxID=48709 RepID=A0A1D2M910_ORCCI|nr:hypothetical protein Ocin01_17217 [Orchesella cincta]
MMRMMQMQMKWKYLKSPGAQCRSRILVDGVNQVEDDELLLDQIVSSPSTSQSDSLSVSDLDEHQLPSSPIYIDLADSSDDENDQEQGAPPNKKIAKRFMDISNPDYIAYSFGDKRFFECRHCAYHGQRSEWLKTI